MNGNNISLTILDTLSQESTRLEAWLRLNGKRNTAVWQEMTTLISYKFLAG